MDHQRGTPAAHAAAIHDEDHRLQGEMTQQDVRIGQKVHFLQDVIVVEPSGKAFDAALGFGAIGDFRGHVGELAALAAYDAADKRRQGVEMAGEVPLGGGGIALRECIAYGTIASEVVTHRLLLQMWCSLNREYTMSQPLKRPFHNNLEKCPVVKWLKKRVWTLSRSVGAYQRSLQMTLINMLLESARRKHMFLELLLNII